MLWSLYSRAGTGRIKESFNIIFLTIVDHYCGSLLQIDCINRVFDISLQFNYYYIREYQ